MTWSTRERHHLQSLLTVLNVRLRETIREDMSGVYAIGAHPRMHHYPEPRYQLYISFGCDPDQVALLTDAVMAEIERLKTEPVEDRYLTKVKQGQLRQRETDLERNEFWLDALTFYVWNDEDPLNLLAFEERVEALTAEDLREAARRYFGTEHVARFTLLPVEQ